MLIVLHIFLMIAFSFFAGFSNIELFTLRINQENKNEIFLITPIIDYVLSQVLFYLWYFLYANSLLSVYSTIATLFFINLVYLYVEFKKSGLILHTIIPPLIKIDKRLLFILAESFILAINDFVCSIFENKKSFSVFKKWNSFLYTLT